MSHPASGGSRLACDETDDRLLELVLDVRGGVFLGVAADLADEHHGLSLGITREEFEGVDERCPDQRVATDPDAGRLPQSKAGQLVDRFVGERTALRDDPDPALLADM